MTIENWVKQREISRNWFYDNRK